MSISSEDPSQLFELIELIGEGSYGEVYSAVYKPTGGMVGLKVIPCEGDPADVLHEIEILASCHSRYIVEYVGAWKRDGDLYVKLAGVALAVVGGARRLAGIFGLAEAPPPARARAPWLCV